VNREAEQTAPTGVGSGDLLGSIIVITKINSAKSPLFFRRDETNRTA
jgi:hypothetical protein